MVPSIGRCNASFDSADTTGKLEKAVNKFD
jgi:hypothetical protein